MAKFGKIDASCLTSLTNHGEFQALPSQTDQALVDQILDLAAAERDAAPGLDDSVRRPPRLGAVECWKGAGIYVLPLPCACSHRVAQAELGALSVKITIMS